MAQLPNIDVADDLLLRTLDDAVLFSESFLRDPVDPSKLFKPRWYQVRFLTNPSKLKVARMGRRIGKSVTLGVGAIWRAMTVPYSQILILGPSDKSITELMDKAIIPMAYESDFIRPAIKSYKKNPHVLTFSNNSTITAQTTGLDGRMLRGTTCDVLILDECDFIPPKAIEAVLPLISSKKNIDVWISSTPTGLRTTFFFKVCTDKALGFEEFHYSAKVSPNYTEAQDKLYRGALSEEAYQHEILAEFGDAAAGVFRENYIQLALADYARNVVDRLQNIPVDNQSDYYMGVDWNGDTTGVQICIMEHVNKPLQLSINQLVSKVNEEPRYTYRPVEIHGSVLRVFYTESISREEYTQSAAVTRIIQLAHIYRLNAINVDIGYGVHQFETLKQFGKQDKKLNFQRILMGTDFGGAESIIDPFTQQQVKKPIKPLMVGLAQRLLEQRRLFFDRTLVGDRQLVAQLRGYTIDHYTPRGAPVYKKDPTHGDHMLDAALLAIYAFSKKHNPLLNREIASNVYPLPQFHHLLRKGQSRQLEGQDVHLAHPVGPKIKGAQYYTHDPRAGNDTHTDGWNSPKNKARIPDSFNRGSRSRFKRTTF